MAARTQGANGLLRVLSNGLSYAGAAGIPNSQVGSNGYRTRYQGGAYHGYASERVRLDHQRTKLSGTTEDLRLSTHEHCVLGRFLCRQTAAAGTMPLGSTAGRQP